MGWMGRFHRVANSARNLEERATRLWQAQPSLTLPVGQGQPDLIDLIYHLSNILPHFQTPASAQASSSLLFSQPKKKCEPFLSCSKTFDGYPRPSGERPRLFHSFHKHESIYDVPGTVLGERTQAPNKVNMRPSGNFS